MKCLYCNSELIWGGVNSYHDYFMDGDGIINNYTCPNLKCKAYFLSFQEFEDDNND